MEKDSPPDRPRYLGSAGAPSLFNFNNVAFTCEPRYSCKPGAPAPGPGHPPHGGTFLPCKHPSYLGEVGYVFHLNRALASNYCQASARHVVGPVRQADSFASKHKISRHPPSQDISVKRTIFLHVNRALNTLET